MIELEAVLESLNHLNPDELMQVRRRVQMLEQQARAPLDDDVETRIAALNAALDNFWEGFTEEEVDEIVWAMNVEFVDPEELKTFDWLLELPENER